jgi:hypothetical protein
VTKSAKFLFFIVLAIVAGPIILSLPPLNGGHGGAQRLLRFDEFAGYLKAKKIRTANWSEHEITGKLDDGATYAVTVPEKDSAAAGNLVSLIAASGADFNFSGPAVATEFANVLAVISFPAMILAVIYFLLIRPVRSPRTVPFAMFSGYTNQVTTAFNIPLGQSASVIWSNRLGEFEATLRRQGDHAKVQLIAKVSGEGSGKTVCNQDGMFYIDIVANGQWAINVLVSSV